MATPEEIRDLLIDRLQSMGMVAAQATTTAPGMVQLAGDLGGTATSPTVPGKAPTASPTFTGTVTTPALKVTGGSPSAGKVLTSDADGDATWAAPSAGSDATTGAKGIVQLAGDLAGTAAAPTVPGLATKVPVGTGTNRVYIRDGSGVEATTSYSSAASASTIVYRTTGGVTSVGEPTTGTHASTKNYTDTQDALRELAANKGVANGYAPLDSGGKVPAANLPSYVDDILEYANTGAFPGTGETGKIYVATGTGKCYRWSGSAYVEVSPSDVNSVAGRTGIVTLTSSDLTDSTTVGRAVVAAADAAAARTAIGAGTSSLALGTSGTTACAGNDARLTDTRTPATGTQFYDPTINGFGAATVRAVGAGDFPMGVKLQRACTFTSVTFRVNTADASGNLVVELRKNGVAVSGTSTTIAAASQVAGGTSTGTWAFAAGDILTVYVTAVGTTPGTGLVADLKGTA